MKNPWYRQRKLTIVLNATEVQWLADSLYIASKDKDTSSGVKLWRKSMYEGLIREYQRMMIGSKG